MKGITITFAFILILSAFSTKIKGQSTDKYKVLLKKDNPKQLEVYDTIVPLKFLSELKYESLTNMQIFEGFGYSKFNLNVKEGSATLFNDSIKINVLTKLFDSIYFKKNYLIDSSLYFESLYFREFPVEFDYPPFFPKD